MHHEDRWTKLVSSWNPAISTRTKVPETSKGSRNWVHLCSDMEKHIAVTIVSEPKPPQPPPSQQPPQPQPPQSCTVQDRLVGRLCVRCFSRAKPLWVFTRESWRLWVVVAKRRASAARHVGSDVRRSWAPPWFTVRETLLELGGSMFSSRRLLSRGFLLVLWFLCMRPLIAAPLA